MTSGGRKGRLVRWMTEDDGGGGERGGQNRIFEDDVIAEQPLGNILEVRSCA